MIIDRLKSAANYARLAARCASALQYLANTDFTQLAEGRYPLDGDRLVAIVQRYQPKPLTEAKWEAHRRFIDVQYVAAGVERMGYVPLTDALPIRKPYDPDKDVILFSISDVATANSSALAPDNVHAFGSQEEIGIVCPTISPVPPLPMPEFFTVRAGMFVLFGPQDVHAPGLLPDAPDTPNPPGEVLKVVVKCLLEPA
jgi:YhcH/YjgK/YiaL family protein